MENSFVKNIGKIFLGDAVVKFLGFASMAFIARLYSPEDFGIMEQITSLFLIFAYISNFKYDLALVLPEEKEKGDNLLGLCFINLAITSTLSFLLVWALLNFFPELEISKKAGKYLYAVPPLIMVRGGKDILIFWFSRYKSFGLQSLGEVFSKIFDVGGKILLGFLSFGVLGLVLGTFSGFAFCFLFFLVITFHKFTPSLKNLSFKKIKDVSKEFSSFPKYSMPAVLFKVVGDRLPALMLLPLFNVSVVGFYAMSYKLINEPINILGTSVARVFFKDASDYSSDPIRLSKFVKNVFEKLVLASIFPILVLAVCGDRLFGIFLGSKWQEAGVYASLLVFFLFFRFLAGTMTYLLNVLQKQYYETRINLLFLFMSFLTLATGYWFSIELTLFIYSLTSGLVFSLLLIIILREVDLGIGYFLKVIFWNLLYTLGPLALIAYGSFGQSSTLMFLVFLFGASLLYYSWLWFFTNKLDFLKDMF